MNILGCGHYASVMPVNDDNYDHRGGGNYGIVLSCPRIVASDHLVYFDKNRDRGTCVIRDFTCGLRLENSRSPLTVQDIEGDADHDEFPIWCNAEQQPSDWKAYLEMRTTAVLRTRRAPSHPHPPNASSGNWLPL